jgi:hypothetical protein
MSHRAREHAATGGVLCNGIFLFHTRITRAAFFFFFFFFPVSLREGSGLSDEAARADIAMWFAGRYTIDDY